MDGRTVKIVPDTNVLIRSVVRDEHAQAAAADKVLKAASSIAIALPCLCEFVWVLRRVYGFSTTDVVSAIQALLDTHNVIVNRPAVEAGLGFLLAGADFADGVIAYEGKWMGAGTFVSFDQKAVSVSRTQGYAARLLG